MYNKKIIGENGFCNLVENNDITLDDFYDSDILFIKKLIDDKFIYIDVNKKLYINRDLYLIYKDLYENDVLCIPYWNKYKRIIKNLVSSNKLKVENTLFTKPEQHYLNYMLNKSEFTNGLDLRNKYIHSTYSFDLKQQEDDCYNMLKIVIMIIGKINNEFILRDLENEN